MNRNNPHLRLSGFVILMAIVACAIPSRTTQLAPTANPNAIGTFIAGTAQAAAQQTEQANLVIVPTPTIVPTETPVPTAVVSAQGTSLETQADGSILFTDHKAGIQVTFPSSWLAIRVGETEFYLASEKVGTQNVWFMQEIAALQNLDLNIFRLNAYDLHPEHILNNTLPKIDVVFKQADKRTLKQIEADERTLINRSLLLGHKHLSSNFQVLSGLDVLIFQSQFGSESPTTHYKGTIFNVPAGTVFIDFYIASEQLDALESEWKQIVESITLLTP